MLAQPSYRQHFSQPSGYPSPTPSHSSAHSQQSHYSYHDRSAPTSTPATLLTAPASTATGLDSISSLSSSLPARGDLSYMASYSNPAIRVQQSTPIPRSQAHGSHWQHLAEGDGSFDVSSMNSPASSSYYPYPVGPSLSTPPLTGKLESYSPVGADQSTRMFSNNLPTPTHTPTQDSFRGRRYTGYNPQSTMAASLALKNEFDNHLTADDDMPGLNHSARHSVSSFGNSPSTPLTAHDDFEDGAFKMPPTDSSLFNSSLMSSSPAPSQRSQGYLSPFGTAHPQVSDFLQKANQHRSQSPNTQRPVSPFRQTSTWFDGQQNRAAAQRQQQMEAEALRQRQSQSTDQRPKTISPKDVELEYHETDESKMPLFPESDQYGTYSGWPMVSSAASGFTFAPTSGPSYPSLQFPPQNFRTASGLLGGPEPIPDFPAHLSSMESSASEAGPESTQTSARSVPEDIARPSSTLADSGTYSCTYHGCAQRFDSPQKLQKHKREGHRQPVHHPAAAPAIGSNMSSAALLARNSQAGPHKCDRINPTTGKSCNTIFSRPYDLTRHEDTIHNGRKQKVRCALCVEEKSFSRNDALTRHMRVVHPEVDFPGKHRRRGE